jgi:threonine dehydrogenase-like Zn-dependent dehydrogenase
MRSVLFESPGTVRLIDDAPVRSMSAGEVTIRCTHVGLCGSNRGPYLGEGRWGNVPWPPPPGWMGHEDVGIIVESRQTDWPVGTPVLAQAVDGNGFAEFIVSRPEAMARLPAEGEDIGGFVIAQPFATVLRALSRTRPPVNECCAVVGQGPIGLMFTHMLRRMGATRVIAIDLVPWRLEWARRFGATDVVDASAVDTVEAVRTPEALITASYLVRFQGRLCIFGVPDHDLSPFPWFDTTNNETEIVLSRGEGSRQFFQQAVDMVAGDMGVLQELVTPRLPWDRAAEAFEMYAHPAAHEDSLKIILELES